MGIRLLFIFLVVMVSLMRFGLQEAGTPETHAVVAEHTAPVNAISSR